MKLCGAVAKADGATIGAVVSLKVDYCTPSHANGLLGVVYAVKEETGGILVCCEHGVITHSGAKADYWVPCDKYRIVAKKGWWELPSLSLDLMHKFGQAVSRALCLATLSTCKVHFNI